MFWRISLGRLSSFGALNRGGCIGLHGAGGGRLFMRGMGLSYILLQALGTRLASVAMMEGRD